VRRVAEYFRESMKRVPGCERSWARIPEDALKIEDETARVLR
jgi:hypothetical protein